MKGFVVILLLGVACTGAQQSFKCPHEFGFYPHDVACDQYWSCDGSIATLKTCGNGLAFDDGDAESLRENCDYYHTVDCSTRPERQPPISTTANCPYQYGIFADDTDCAVFWSCWGGEAARYECGPGLAYSIESRVCTWVDQVPECAATAQGLFQCPNAGSIVPSGAFSRHSHPEDCRQFFVCLDSVPREYGCPIGTVFNIGATEGTGECSPPESVPGCEAYYGELDLTAIRESQLLLGNFGQGTQPPLRRQRIEQPLLQPKPVEVKQSRKRVQVVKQEVPQQQPLPQAIIFEDQPIN